MAASAAAQTQPLRFIALGDMPYGQEVRSGPAYRHLIGLINAERLPFAIHVGDIKDGLTECSDALFERQSAYFASYDKAVIYTPGDNDWVDCQRQGSDPLERLDALRRRFFATAKSLGARPIQLQRQAALMPAYTAFVENQRWWSQQVLFASFHTVGPDDNTSDPAPALQQEQRTREAANVAWIRDAFLLARLQGARALVLATQADVVVQGDTLQVPFKVVAAFQRTFVDTLLPLAQAAPFPVLLIHGDSHRMISDQPFYDAAGAPIRNLWRLQVPGADRMHAVIVSVAAGTAPPADAPTAPPAPPFGFQLLWNPMSPDPH